KPLDRAQAELNLRSQLQQACRVRAHDADADFTVGAAATLEAATQSYTRPLGQGFLDALVELGPLVDTIAIQENREPGKPAAEARREGINPEPLAGFLRCAPVQRVRLSLGHPELFDGPLALDACVFAPQQNVLDLQHERRPD